MQSIDRVARAAAISAVVAAFPMAVSGPASAQGKLEARYNISVTGIRIGKGLLTVDVGNGRYVSEASGRASGMLSVLFNGQGTVSARGALKDGRPVPASFVSVIAREGETVESRMTLENGAVIGRQAEIDPPPPDRVPLMDEHQLNVIDPLSAMLVPLQGAYDVLSADACQRTLPVFDGRRRYDLKLTFKRMDQAKADKGYAGPVVVCGVTFQAQAGHRASSTLVKYLSEGRDVELWLAPVSGTRVLAPIRASVGSMLGNLVVQATQFETLSQTAAVTPPAP